MAWARLGCVSLELGVSLAFLCLGVPLGWVGLAACLEMGVNWAGVEFCWAGLACGCGNEFCWAGLLCLSLELGRFNGVEELCGTRGETKDACQDSTPVRNYLAFRATEFNGGSF